MFQFEGTEEPLNLCYNINILMEFERTELSQQYTDRIIKLFGFNNSQIYNKHMALHFYDKLSEHKIVSPNDEETTGT